MLQLDIMLVNHGVGHGDEPERITPEDWDRMIGINLTSAFICAQIAGRHMIKQGGGGDIVFISSTSSMVVFERLTAYGAAKDGVDHLARHLAVEWAPHGIRVSVIAPGFMASHMRGSESCHEDEDGIKATLASTPMARKGQPEELVGPAVFLASDPASFITDHVIPVDGGWCLP